MTNSSEITRIRSQDIINGDDQPLFPRQYRCVRIVLVRNRLKDASDDCIREFRCVVSKVTALRFNAAHVQLAEIDRYLTEQPDDRA